MGKKEIIVRNVVHSNRSMEICWEADGKEKRSRFYRHHDGSWGMDPYLASQSATIQSLLWTLANAKEVPKKTSVCKIVMSWE